MKFEGRILVIGLGAVSRCLMPLLAKHLKMDRRKLTVIDYADVGDAANELVQSGAVFKKDRITRANMGQQLAKYVGKGDIIIDLAWNIGCCDILQWCRDHGVRYVNTSVEVWDPYEGAENKRPIDRTLYARHMDMRRMFAAWGDNKGPTAVLDHGANPGLVQHFTKEALVDIARKLLEDFPARNKRRERISDALKKQTFNRLAMELGVKVIHISERDTQITSQPKAQDEFVNTWSIEGFREEGVAPAEMGWGTHERTLPPRACTHLEGPGHQICLAQMGCRTWVRSWVPCGEIVGMVIRHGEAFSISEYLTVIENGQPVYRPTVHYAYCPCDSAIASLHELQMRNYELQPRLRIMNDDIVEGRDELGCLLMGHDYKSWWIGSLLDIHETRRLTPHQNATTLQVAVSVLAALAWLIENPNQGVRLPDELPHDFILEVAKPYLGPFVSQPVDWTPLKNWSHLYQAFGVPRPSDQDVWQFGTFLVNNISGAGY